MTEYHAETPSPGTPVLDGDKPGSQGGPPTDAGAPASTPRRWPLSGLFGRRALLLVPAAGLALILIARHNFLLAHVLAEGWSILVAFLMLVLVIETRRYAVDSFLLMLGVAYAGVAALDLMHTVTYPGMRVLPIDGTHPSSQFWIAARYLQALSLLLAPWLSRRRLRRVPLALVYALLVTTVLLSIFSWHVFPACYVSGEGLTPFKILSEYVICVILAVAALLVYRERERLGALLSCAVIASILCTVVAEVLFTLYVSVYGFINILGHVFKDLSFYILYRGVVVRGLHGPFELKEAAERSVRRGREELRRSLALLHGALDATTDALLITDLEWRIVVCNDKFSRLWGGRPEDTATGARLLERGDSFLASVATPADLREHVVRLDAEPGAPFFEVLTFSDGRIMECSSSPFLVDGRISGRVWSLHEITQRRRAEEERNRLRDALAHATRVTTMGHLAGSIAHEINQPLAAIMNNAEAGLLLLEEDRPNLQELQSAFEDIREDDRRAGEVIRRLHEFLRRGAPTRCNIDLNGIVREVCDMLHATIEKQGVEISFVLQPDLPGVEGDRVQLQQVVLNLVLNGLDAIDALANNEAPRELVVRSFVADPKTAEVQVQDSGIGLGDNQDRVFEQFYTTKPDGLGMGLAISRTIVESHEGRLWSTPAPGGGTIFHFALPVDLLAPAP